MLSSRASRTDIRRLVVEHPEREDTLRLISPKDWEAIIATLELYKSLKKWQKFRALAAAATWANAGNFSMSDLGLDNKVWERMTCKINTTLSKIDDSNRSKEKVPALATSIMETAILFPQKRIGDYRFRKPIRGLIEKRITYCLEKSQWLELVGLLFSLKIITSAGLAEKKDEHAALQRLREGLDAHRAVLLRSVRLAAKVRVLFQEAMPTFQIDDSLWGRLDDYRERKDWGRFGRLAASMKILIVDEVVISNGQLSFITRPQKTDEATSPIHMERVF